MSGQFKKGDVAIVQNAVNPHTMKYNSTECTVLNRVEIHVSLTGFTYNGYDVLLCDGSKKFAADFQLRRKLPPPDHIEWAKSKVDDLFKPQKVTA